MERRRDESAQGRIAGFDALRGIAALMVVLFHVEFAFHLQPRFERAYLAVDFFFLLSGALMARQYEGRFPETIAFLALRLRRLWPVMALGAVLGTLAFVTELGPFEAALGLVMGLMLIPFLGSDKGLFPLNPPAWSVLYELCANVAHAAVLHRLATRWLLGIAAVCLLLLCLAADSLNLGAERSTAALAILRVTMSYSLGISLWRLRDSLPTMPAEVGCLVLPGAVLALPQLPISELAGDLAFAIVVSPLALMAGRGPLTVFEKPFQRLGWLSFPLYAVHLPIIMMVGPQYGPVAALAAVFVGAWCAARAFDWLNSLSRRKRVSRELATAG